MRFPIDATRQTRCPVCKAASPGTDPPATPRPETASLSFAVWHQSAEPTARPVVLGGDLALGWDAGVCKSSRSPTTLGAVVRAAQLQAPRAGEGLIQLRFCSIACLRQFLQSAVDELERRAAAVRPQVEVARGWADAEPGAADRGRG
jgi:hypothetical protein